MPLEKPYPLERRSARRKYAKIPIRFKAISGKNLEIMSLPRTDYLDNIGMEGLAFQTSSMEIEGIHLSFDQDFSRNMLYMEVDLPRPGRTIKAYGRVEWYERTLGRGEKEFTVGVLYTDMPDDDRNALQRFLEAEE
ncbi:MAG: hypothetical protein JRG73_13745 [Deltaproteobacteria bacterium]|nr:hypothetical protein [Deltaproteobacteria bacterium]MBW2307984.1 hypothetical protein [Deltaproteobacteria bacterium]